jgi:hypothetical protein
MDRQDVGLLEQFVLGNPIAPAALAASGFMFWLQARVSREKTHKDVSAGIKHPQYCRF